MRFSSSLLLRFFFTALLFGVPLRFCEGQQFDGFRVTLRQHGVVLVRSPRQREGDGREAELTSIDGEGITPRVAVEHPS
ncbi:MAG: hypothetical protein JKY65_13150 [Planctomycetes bacterium]|nr:hypothetical protein [Planctomycetota bacterium]